MTANNKNIDKQGKKLLNVPNLRFPEFEGEWTTKRLEDCVLFLDDQRKPVKSSDRQNVPGIYPYYGASGIIDYVDNYLFDDDLILLSEDGANILDRNYRVSFISRGKVWINNHAHVLKPKPLYSIDYLSEYLESLDYNIYNTGTTMPKLNQEVCRGIKIYVPSESEQKKIGRFLNLVNERISTQNRIIEKYESLIKGIAKQLAKHTPNTRIADCVECHSSTLQENQLDGEGIYKVYGANGLCGYTKTPSISGDSILIVKDGSGVGNVSYVNGDYSVIGTSNYLTAKESFSLRYIYYCLMVFNFQPYKTGMAIPHIYFKDYGKAKIYCPKREQQENIAAILYIIEHKINMEKSIKDLFISQKKYLLRSMFK